MLIISRPETTTMKAKPEALRDSNFDAVKSAKNEEKMIAGDGGERGVEEEEGD